MKLYQKYLPEWKEIHAVIHQHWIVVMDSFILWVSFGAIIPAFLYYQSERLRELIPFYALEILLFLVFCKVLYELFNWYHDVWIISDDAVYDLEWSLLKTNLENIHYENIEGVEIDKHRIWDSVFNKWDIIIHKFWEEELAIINAASPYKAVDILEWFIHPWEEHEERDRFDMIMDTLSWVVTEYLDKHGLRDRYDDPRYSDGDETKYNDDYTVDLSNEK